MGDCILKTRDLCAGYKGKNVIENINLSFEKGKIYSIIGPNGCGKTTLMRAISRNLRPQSGQVLLREEDIFHMNTKKVARHVAMLSQHNLATGDITVGTLVSYGRYAHRQWWQSAGAEDSNTVQWALSRTGMEEYANRKITDLSGGERQRAWIAMSIAQKPEILLLDEPTTYLDIAHQLEIMELVSSLNREEGITIIMVIHDINHAARYSDQMVVIHDHQVCCQDDPWTLLKGDMLRDVFHVEADISKDQENGTPIFYAKKVVSPN